MPTRSLEFQNSNRSLVAKPVTEFEAVGAVGWFWGRTIRHNGKTLYFPFPTGRAAGIKLDWVCLGLFLFSASSLYLHIYSLHSLPLEMPASFFCIKNIAFFLFLFLLIFTRLYGSSFSWKLLVGL